MKYYQSVLIFGSLDLWKTVNEKGEHPIILWNHRWEFDKAPESFFQALFELQEKGVDFRLVVLGEQNEMKPNIFEEARDKLSDKILHYGYAESFKEYAKWLWKSDILPVTSIHDFFGISVVEAMHCDCYPILPNRLAYPEHVSKEHLYEEGELLDQIIHVIENKKYQQSKTNNPVIESYNWLNCIEAYDEALELVKMNADSKK